MVFETMVPRNVRLGEAPSHGKPAILYDILSPGAVSYLNLAAEILGEKGEIKIEKGKIVGTSVPSILKEVHEPGGRA